MKRHLIENNQQGLEPHLPYVRLQGPQGAPRRLLEVMSQLGTSAILQDLDHQGEQLLSQTNVVIHDLDETAITVDDTHFFFF